MSGTNRLITINEGPSSPLEKSWAADGRPRGGETNFADAKGERHVVTVRAKALKSNERTAAFADEVIE